MKYPLPSLVVLNCALVPVLVMLMEAFATTAPEGSATVPAIEP
jgi:hypothetical protein